MLGFKAGAEFFGKVKLGFGFYSHPRHYLINFPEQPAGIKEEARLRYTMFFSEWLIYRNFRWEFLGSAAAGSGRLSIKRIDSSGPLPNSFRFEVAGMDVFDVGLYGRFKVVSWLGVGAGVGRRWIKLPRETKFQRALSVPYYNIRFEFYPGYLFKALFREEAIQLEKTYYQVRREKRLKALKSLWRE